MPEHTHHNEQSVALFTLGDNKAKRYELLVKHYHADLYRYGYWLCKDAHIAQDLVQETFLRAWKSLDSLLDAKAAKAWLFTILRRENARRFERKQFDYDDGAEQDNLADHGPTSAEQCIDNAKLREHLAALAHVHHEHNTLLTQASVQPLDEVNLKLADFGVSLQQWQDEIIYARYCTFQGVRSLHLAVKTASGYATIFVIPKDTDLKASPHFTDQRYQGLTLAMHNANVVVVSDNPADLQQLPAKLQRKLVFSA